MKRTFEGYPQSCVALCTCSVTCFLQVFLIMDCEEIPEFSSPEEETTYWKKLSSKYKQRYHLDSCFVLINVDALKGLSSC